jgi:hypothetical protein
MIPDSRMPGLYIIGSRVVDSVFQLQENIYDYWEKLQMAAILF